MTPNKYEIAERKAKKIMVWCPDYIRKVFSSKRMYHHLEKHINLSEKEMKRRVAREKVDVSTFVGNESAILNLLLQTLLDSVEEIAYYLADDSKRPWEVSGILPSHIKGYCYKCTNHNWDDGQIECTEFKIVINKIKGENGFAILSCYPSLN